MVAPGSVRADLAPVVTAPANQLAGAGITRLTFTVSASDPDGDAINSLTSASSPATTGSTFTANASNTSGTFSWAPTLIQSGFYTVTFTASNSLSGAAATVVTVVIVDDRAPGVFGPATVSGDENTLITFTVVVADPDGDAITTFTASSVPATTGSSFTSNASNTLGTFSWTPSFAQHGSYNVTFTAISGRDFPISSTMMTTITVRNVDRPPTVTAPATQSVAEDQFLTFTISASDPDGDRITSLTASDLPTGSVFTTNANSTSGTFTWTPSGAQAGTHLVSFHASNRLTGTASTQIVVEAKVIFGAFVTGSNKAIRPNTGLSRWCAHVEPQGVSVSVFEIDPSSVVLRSVGTGPMSEIPASVDKTLVAGDTDNDGVIDAEFCFAKANLELLFGNLTGKTTVDVTVAGRLLSGRSFIAPLTIEVAGRGGGDAAGVAPNPLNPSGTLSFRTQRGGDVRVRLFDGAGRCVRTVFEASLPAGAHTMPLEARDASGRPLASGVYFYRVDSAGGTATGRFVVAK